MAYDYREIQAIPFSTLFVDRGSRGTATALITPEQAGWLVENRNGNNRKMSKAVVRNYANMMASGQWDWCDGDSPIKFGEDGSLLNGQHRLAAQAIAGVNGVYDIRTGVPDISYRVMDSGKTRSVADYFRGRVQSVIVSALAGYIVRVNDGRYVLSGGSANKNISRVDVIQYCEDHYEELLVYCNYGHRIQKQLGRGGPSVYALVCYMIDQNGGDVEAFVDAFVEGSDGTEASKNTILKKLVVSEFRPDATWYVGVILLCYDAWLAGKSVKVIYRERTVNRFQAEVDRLSASVHQDE